jgi:hypothetical protein
MVAVSDGAAGGDMAVSLVLIVSVVGGFVDGLGGILVGAGRLQDNIASSTITAPK